MVDRIGKYEIRTQIGRSGLSVVYEGFDTRIKRRVAVKLLRVDEFAPDQLPVIRARFLREAQAAGRLSHPNIVTIYDSGELEGTPYIVMEFLTGRELNYDLGRGVRFPLDDVVRIMTQMLGALGHAHENGVVHRDIKPSNMFLLEDGSLKIVDFGITWVEAPHITDTGAMLETLAHKSPEQIKGVQVDHRSDIFSAGVILYQLLTGDKPFTGRSFAEIIETVMQHEPMPPSALNPMVSAPWEEVVARAMAKKPEARYQSARQFAEAIKFVQATESEVHQPTVIRSGKVKWKEREADTVGAEANSGGEKDLITPVEGQAPDMIMKRIKVLAKREAEQRAAAEAKARLEASPAGHEAKEVMTDKEIRVPTSVPSVVHSPDARSEDPKSIKVFFGTDRAPTGSMNPRRWFGRDRGALTVGLCNLSIPPGHDYARLERPTIPGAGNPQKHFVLSSINVLNAIPFTKAVDEGLTAASPREAFVFVHGFNESFASAAYRTAQLAIDLKFPGIAAFYSWPSMSSFLSYIADGTTIERSVRYLTEFLVLLAGRSTIDRVHVIAHSMGNRGLTRSLPEALQQLPENRRGVFREVILAAPDVDAEVFKQEIVPKMCPYVTRTTLYASSRDRALRLSRFLHNFPRLGLITDGVCVVQGMDTIDASDTDLSLLGSRHSPFSEAPAVVDDVQLTIFGVSAERRPRLDPRTASGQRYWWFKS